MRAWRAKRRREVMQLQGKVVEYRRRIAELQREVDELKVG
jgi:hypothetical protein